MANIQYYTTHEVAGCQSSVQQNIVQVSKDSKDKKLISLNFGVVHKIMHLPVIFLFGEMVQP